MQAVDLTQIINNKWPNHWTGAYNLVQQSPSCLLSVVPSTKVYDMMIPWSIQ